MIQLEGAWDGDVLQKQQWKVYWCIVYVLSVYLWCIDNVFFMHAKHINNVLSKYFQCIQDVSWMYYEGNIHVSLMYYGCIGTCTSHLCFPPYSTHHLFGAQPIRASSFGHQQPMDLAPGGWGQPWHGSTRHAFWPAGHGCSSMPCWVLSSRNHPWAGIHMGPLHSMHQAWHTGLLWGAKQGPKDSEKYQLST